jgi:hypothetical protein
MPGLDILDDVRIASPCSARWEDMTGSDRVRFCASCQKNVFNLSGMKREEAIDLLRATDGRICARIYQRADGTVLSADCPVGLRLVARRAKRMAFGAVAASFGAVAAVLGFLASSPMRRVVDVEPVRKVIVEKAQRIEEIESSLVPDPGNARPLAGDVAEPIAVPVGGAIAMPVEKPIDTVAPPTPRVSHKGSKAKVRPAKPKVEPVVEMKMGDVALPTDMQ